MKDQIQQLQLTQIEILKEIDSVCRENGLHYSLYTGTLLGAVRHKGFIPWDDDLDICMARDDYNKFLKIWDDKKHPGFLIQYKDIANGFSQSFAKVRKDHTTFWQEGEPNDRYHIGIFVDIFPIDRIPSGKLRRMIFQCECILYQIITREYPPIHGNKIERFLTKFVLLLIRPSKRKSVRSKLLKRIVKWNSQKEYSMVAIEIMSTIKTPLPNDMMDNFISMEFNGEQFMATTKWHEYLTLRYHDYMQLPPEKDRVWKHHPKILDFERNYNEIVYEKREKNKGDI